MDFVKEIKSTTKRKETIIIVGIIILVLLGLSVYQFYLKKEKEISPTPALSPEELRIKKQREELEKLRQELGIKPFSQEEINQQVQQLEKLRQEQGAKPFSEEEIEKQAEELEKLRSKK